METGINMMIQQFHKWIKVMLLVTQHIVYFIKLNDPFLVKKIYHKYIMKNNNLARNNSSLTGFQKHKNLIVKIQDLSSII